MKTNLFKTTGKYALITSLTTTTVVVAVLVTTYYPKPANPGTVSPHSSRLFSDSAKVLTASTAVKRRIQPPIKNADVPYKSFHCKAEKGGTIAYGNSHLRIPANSLVDKNGKLVKGDVNIQYREFHSPLEFFASGIPMTYDLGGKEYTFESDGMFDIKGYKNGEEVFVKPGKQITIEMASLQGKAHYNFYRFDTLTGQWALLQPDVPVKIVAPTSPDTIAAENKRAEALKEDVTNIQQDEKKIEDDAPFEPRKAGNARCYVSIDADTNEYPELAMYRGIWFAVDLHDTGFSLRYTANYRVWENMSFKRINKGETYEATVSSGNESHSFLLHPVFEGNAYETAIAKYNTKFKEYDSMLNEKKEEERKKQEAYQALLAKQEAEKKKQLQIQFTKDLKTDLTSATSYYCLTIKNFGTYNCDSPESRPQGAALAATFTDNKKEDLSSKTVYLVEKGKNMLNTYSPGESFCFNPKSVNFAWCITPDNHIAMLTDEDFRKVTKTNGNYTFVLQKSKKTFANEEELDAFFKQYM
jgi:hypothetical protein